MLTGKTTYKTAMSLKIMAACSVAGVLALIAFCLFWCISPHSNEQGYRPNGQSSPGCDFILRRNEIRCVQAGINPYGIWNETVRHPLFCAYAKGLPFREGVHEPVNAYPPWSYSFLMPIALVPIQYSWWCFVALMAALILGLFACGYAWSFAQTNDKWKAALCASLPLVVLAYPIWSNFRAGNLGLVVLAALVAAVFALNRGHDILAGLCWAFAMNKPQLALLFAVPLVVKKKFTTCTVAAGTCVVASLWAVVKCKTPLMQLVGQAVAGSSSSFQGCGTWPTILSAVVPDSIGVYLALGIGFSLCVILTIRLRKVDDWLVYAAPAFVCGMTWSYANHYCLLMDWGVVLYLCVNMVRGTCGRFFAFFTLVIFSNILVAVSGFLSTVDLPFVALPTDWHPHIRSLHGSALLLLTFILLRSADGRTSAPSYRS